MSMVLLESICIPKSALQSLGNVPFRAREPMELFQKVRKN